MTRLCTLTLILTAAASSSHADDWPMFGGRPDRNNVSTEKGLPLTWNLWEKKNFKWVARLGEHNHSMPAISGGRIFIGTDLQADPDNKKNKGVFICLSEKDGSLLWRMEHEKLASGEAEDFPGVGICSSPCVAGDQVFYVSNRGELVCREVKDGKQVWSLDMLKELGVSPNQASASSPLVVGDQVFVHTGNGTDFRSQQRKVKFPQAPSFIAVNRLTGKVMWQDNSPGDRILLGQWSSPAYGVVDGQPQVAFPGGDGWLYSFDPATGKLIWKFDCKAHEAPPKDGKPETPNQIIAMPVFTEHRVIISVGVEPEGTPADRGCVRAIDARLKGDITQTGELWRFAGEDYFSSLSSVAVYNGLVFAADIQSRILCLDLASGKVVWKHDLLTSIFGSPLVAEGRLYIQDQAGEVHVFEAGREKKILARNNVLPKKADSEFAHGTPVAANGVLYIVGERKLFAFAVSK